MRSDFSLNTARKERTYDVLYSPYKEKAEMVQKILGKSDISKETEGKQKETRVAIVAPTLQQYNSSYRLVKRKIRTRLDLLSIPQSGGEKCQNV